jgi:hypothetical protein
MARMAYSQVLENIAVIVAQSYSNETVEDVFLFYCRIGSSYISFFVSAMKGAGDGVCYACIRYE